VGRLIQPYRFAVAGSGGGPYAFVKSAGAADDTSDTSMAVALATVTAGHLIVVWAKYEGATTTVTISDGTTSLTPRTTRAHANSDLHGQFFYLPASVASGSVTYTATWSAARTYKALIAFEINPTGTAVYDTEALNSGTSIAVTSGNITTAAADSVVLAGYSNYTVDIMSVRTINTVANDNNRAADNTTGATTIRSCVWENVFTSTFTGAADALLPNSTSEWVCNIIAFK